MPALRNFDLLPFRSKLARIADVVAYLQFTFCDREDSASA